MSSSGNPLASLIVRFAAETGELHAGFDDVAKQMDGLGDRAIKFGEKFAEGLSFVELTKTTFEAGEEFENAMLKIERATGAVGEPLAGLEESFSKTFGNVVQGADDVAGGLALLSQRTGATGEDLDNLVEINSKLAQVLGQTLQPTVESTQKVFAAFKTSIEDQPEKLDALLAISQKSGISFNTLVGGLQTIGPTLRGMGLDITDSAALLANFEEQGISTGKVAGTLNATLVSLAKEGFVDPKAALGEFLQQIIDAKDPTEALQLAAENFKGKGLVPLVDALQNGAGNLATLRDAAANSKGRIDETADSTQTLSQKFTLLEGATTKLLAPIGIELVAALSHLVDAGTATVKFIDSIVQKADELDKTFGTDAEHISGFSELFVIMGKAIAEKAIPGFKGLSDEAATSKFLDGTMANGIKTISEMFPEFGKNVGNAQDKFVDLDKELKEAEKNLSEVEKAVRLGIGTDEDAAAARLKVVSAMQALHPEFTNIFAETDSWNSVLKISDDLIGEQYEALLKLAPTISAHTALLESQAISLKTRADLWPIDMQGIEDQADALTASSDALSINNVNMKGFDEVLKLVQTGTKDQEKAIQQQTAAFGPLHDAHLLGINDGTELAKRMDETHAAYLRVTGAVDDEGRAVYNLHQQQIAQLADIRATIAEQQSLGLNTDALQLKAIHLADAIHAQNVGYTDTVVAIHNIVGSGITNAFNDLITGAGGAGDAIKKMGESVVTTFGDRILNDALKPVLADLDSIIDKALNASGKLLGLNPSSPISAAGGVDLGLPKQTISDIPKLPGIPSFGGVTGSGEGGIEGIGTNAGDFGIGGDSGEVAGAGGAGSSLGLGSSFSSFLSAAGAIGGVVSAVSGIIGNFQNARQEGTLNAVESNTRVGALYSLGTLRELELHTRFYNSSLFPELKGILDWQGYIVNSITALGSINLSALPGQIATALTPVLKPGSTGAPININIYGATDPAATADSVATMLKTLSPVFT